MDEEHRKTLKNSHVKLKRDLPADKVARTLFSRGIFDEEDRDDILALKTRHEQAGKLLDLLPLKGPEAFKVFYEALQTVSPHLANIISPLTTGVTSSFGSSKQQACLPSQVGNFVGRDDLCQDIVHQLNAEGCKLIFLVAPPFNGKSATATRVGHILENQGLQVMYFPLRGVTSLTQAAELVLRLLGQIVSNEPAVQLKQLLRSIDKKTVIVLDNTEDLQEQEEWKLVEFLKYIGQFARHLSTIVTTRKAVHGVSAVFPFHAKSIPLKPLTEDDSVELLQHLVPRLPPRQAKRLSKGCMGVPFLLRSLSSVVNNGDNIESLLQELERNPRILLQGESSDLKDYFSYLDLFIKQLPQDLATALVRLAVFPTNFTSEKAQFLFADKTIDFNYFSCLSRLVDYSLLNLDTEKASYELHPQVQAFCRAQQGNPVLGERYTMATRLYIQFFLSLLRDLGTQFVSRENKLAVERYFDNKRNIDEALELSSNDIYFRHYGIDVSTEVVNFLAKVLSIGEFETIYYAFEKTAYDLIDEKRQSNCLTSIGFKLVCYHGSHDTAEAKEVLTKAQELQSRVRPDDSEECAHCLSKLGLCLVRSGEVEEGIRMIVQAIGMRKRIMTLRGGSLQSMLVSGGYCDLAMALSTIGRPKAAIKIWTTLCLETYDIILGCHPFTATLLQYIGEAYHRLADYPNAVDYKTQSLDMRTSVFGYNHPDTARSYFCLAQTLVALQCYEEAMDMLQQTRHIQVRVLASPGDVNVTRREMERVGQIQRDRDLHGRMRDCHISSRREQGLPAHGAIPSL